MKGIRHFTNPKTSGSERDSEENWRPQMLWDAKYSGIDRTPLWEVNTKNIRAVHVNLEEVGKKLLASVQVHSVGNLSLRKN